MFVYHLASCVPLVVRAPRFGQPQLFPTGTDLTLGEDRQGAVRAGQTASSTRVRQRRADSHSSTEWMTAVCDWCREGRVWGSQHV